MNDSLARFCHENIYEIMPNALMSCVLELFGSLLRMFELLISVMTIEGKGDENAKYNN